MTHRATERTSAVAGLVSVVAVGVGVGVGVVMLLAASDSAADASPAHPAWWWSAYLLYLVVFLVVDEYLPRPTWVSDDALIVALVVFGVAVFLLFPDPGWTAILLVVTAAMTAFVWPTRPSSPSSPSRRRQWAWAWRWASPPGAGRPPTSC
jgi:hypothetical protein